MSSSEAAVANESLTHDALNAAESKALDETVQKLVAKYRQCGSQEWFNDLVRNLIMKNNQKVMKLTAERDAVLESQHLKEKVIHTLCDQLALNLNESKLMDSVHDLIIKKNIEIQRLGNCVQTLQCTVKEVQEQQQKQKADDQLAFFQQLDSPGIDDSTFSFGTNSPPIEVSTTLLPPTPTPAPAAIAKSSNSGTITLKRSATSSNEPTKRNKKNSATTAAAAASV